MRSDRGPDFRPLRRYEEEKHWSQRYGEQRAISGALRTPSLLFFAAYAFTPLREIMPSWLFLTIWPVTILGPVTWFAIRWLKEQNNRHF